MNFHSSHKVQLQCYLVPLHGWNNVLATKLKSDKILVKYYYKYTLNLNLEIYV